MSLWVKRKYKYRVYLKKSFFISSRSPNKNYVLGLICSGPIRSVVSDILGAFPGVKTKVQITLFAQSDSDQNTDRVKIVIPFKNKKMRAWFYFRGNDCDIDSFILYAESKDAIIDVFPNGNIFSSSYSAKYTPWYYGTVTFKKIKGEGRVNLLTTKQELSDMISNPGRLGGDLYDFIIKNIFLF